MHTHTKIFLGMYCTSQEQVRRNKPLKGLYFFITLNNFVAFKPFNFTLKEPLSYAVHTDPETMEVSSLKRASGGGFEIMWN